MTENKDCKIIQDLLPNYIEKLTNEDTNKYIEEHINNCNDCNRILENMKKDFKINNTKVDKREVKYIKKYSNKLNLLKIIILIFLIIFVVIVVRKMLIFSDLKNKAQEYTSSTNYHMTGYSYMQDETVKTELFVLDNRRKVIITKMLGNEKNIVTMFTNGSNTNVYVEYGNKKFAKVNQSIGIASSINNAFYTDNIWQLLLYSIPASIKNKNISNDEYYYIANYNNPHVESNDGIYVNKQTGLIYKAISSTETMSSGDIHTMPTKEYIYEFNVVEENDFIEPNIDEYEIK